MREVFFVILKSAICNLQFAIGPVGYPYPGRICMKIILANPRGFCAGVNMAIDSLERADWRE